jgi:TPR repeat protein
MVMLSLSDENWVQGDRESHNGLGIMYRNGHGVKKNTQRAGSYFQAAANYELADALVNLGKLYLGRLLFRTPARIFFF